MTRPSMRPPSFTETGFPRRRLLGLVVSNLLGILAYGILTPVIVLYTALVLAVLAFGLIGGGITVDGSPVQNVFLGALAIGDGVWVEWVWRRDLTFEQNALRIFGGLGVLLWIGELVVARFRTDRAAPAVPLLDRLKRIFLRLGVLTFGLATVLLASIVAAQARDAEVTSVWILQATATAYAMGLVVYLFSAPALILWLLVNAARGPMAAALSGESEGGQGMPHGAPPDPWSGA